MTTAQSEEPTSPKPIRLWPGVAAAVLQLALRFGLPVVVPEAGPIAGIGGVLCALVILVWWAFFSRVPRWERWGALVLIIVALAAASRIIHPSIATGMMGMMFYVYAIPIVSLALVAWAVASRSLAVGPRRAALAAAIVLACGVFALLRTDGILGGGGSQLAWRWSPTAEERLLAQAGDEFAAPPATVIPEPEPLAPNPETPVDRTPSENSDGARSTPAAAGDLQPQPPSPDGKVAGNAQPGEEPAALPTAGDPTERLTAKLGEELAPHPAGAKAAADWPGFRGPNRDGAVHGVRIKTDWSQSPPVELWRRPVGPGWSSFAVHDNLVYTQEQRGDDEVVACYDLTNGKPVWMHRDAARFWESNAGAGPRATPTISNGRVYTFGGTGILNALDARSGAVVWTRNAASDTGAKVPYWGFASSPLVVDDLVVVAAAGQLAAYDLASGDPRWTGPAHGDSYSSPQRLTIGGVPQILLLSAAGATSVAPADGALLWEHAWGGFTSLQPAQTADGDVLLTVSGATGGLGTRRLAVAQDATGWTAAERWTSDGLKPYFNDFVINDGHAYGFDGRILSCIDLANGQRKWKGGRYGNGQLVLLADQDLLLVLSDEGELALVEATPGEFKELARVPAIEGKTWNHPVVAGDVLLVRNDREMAAFRLELAEH